MVYIMNEPHGACTEERRERGFAAAEQGNIQAVFSGGGGGGSS